MKKFDVRKIVLFVLIAVSAFACIGTLGVALNNVEKNQVVQGLHIEGLEFEDGWNLISDADDYYIMCNAVNSGVGVDANYKLTNDITVAQNAGMNVFSGTLDGNNHNISFDSNLQYKPEIYAGAGDSFDLRTMTLAGAGVELGAQEYGSSTVVYPALGLNLYITTKYSKWDWFYGYSLGAGQNVAYLTDESEDVATVSGGANWNLNNGNSQHLNSIHCFGMYGVLDNCSVRDLYVTYEQSVTIDGEKAASIDDYPIYLGGIAGYAYNTTFDNCIVRFENDAQLTISGDCTNAYSRVGGIVGRIHGENSYMRNCLVITDSEPPVASTTSESDKKIITGKIVAETRMSRTLIDGTVRCTNLTIPGSATFIFNSLYVYDDYYNVDYEQTSFTFEFVYTNGCRYRAFYESERVKCNVPVSNCYWISSEQAEDIDFFRSLSGFSGIVATTSREYYMSKYEWMIYPNIGVVEGSIVQKSLVPRYSNEVILSLDKDWDDRPIGEGKEVPSSAFAFVETDCEQNDWYVNRGKQARKIVPKNKTLYFRGETTIPRVSNYSKVDEETGVRLQYTFEGWFTREGESFLELTPNYLPRGTKTFYPKFTMPKDKIAFQGYNKIDPDTQLPSYRLGGDVVVAEAGERWRSLTISLRSGWMSSTNSEYAQFLGWASTVTKAWGEDCDVWKYDASDKTAWDDKDFLDSLEYEETENFKVYKLYAVWGRLTTTYRGAHFYSHEQYGGFFEYVENQGGMTSTDKYYQEGSWPDNLGMRSIAVSYATWAEEVQKTGDWEGYYGYRLFKPDDGDNSYGWELSNRWISLPRAVNTSISNTPVTDADGYECIFVGWQLVKGSLALPDGVDVEDVLTINSKGYVTWMHLGYEYNVAFESVWERVVTLTLSLEGSAEGIASTDPKWSNSMSTTNPMQVFSFSNNNRDFTITHLYSDEISLSWSSDIDGIPSGYRLSSWYEKTTDWMYAWYESKTGGGKLVAVFEAIEYTLTFNYNGGTDSNGKGKQDIMFTVADLPMDIPYPEIKQDACILVGWQVTKGSAILGDSTVTIATGTVVNITIQAVWKEAGWSIIVNSDKPFELNNGFPEMYEYSDEDREFALFPRDKYINLIDITWDDSDNSMAEVYKNSEEWILLIPGGSTGNIVIDLEWTDKYTINLDLQGGSGGGFDTSVGVGEYESSTKVNYPKPSSSYRFTLKAPTKDGYTFMGWDDDYDDTVDCLSDGDEPVSIAKGVSIIQNENDLSEPALLYISAECTIESLTLYAIWKEATYYIYVYDDTNFFGNTLRDQYPFDVSTSYIDLDSSVDAETGADGKTYSFVNYKLHSSLTNPSGVSLYGNRVYMSTNTKANIYVEIVRTSNYTITINHGYDPGGNALTPNSTGGFISADPYGTELGNEYTLNQDYDNTRYVHQDKLPTREGYKFNGWYGYFGSQYTTPPSGESISIEKKSSASWYEIFIPAGTYGNIELYPIWEPVYTITVDSNGGTGGGILIGGNLTTQTTYQETLLPQTFTLVLPTRDKYEFDGWAFVENSTSASSISSDGLTLTLPRYATGNIEIIATWEISGRYSITLELAGGSLDVEGYNHTIENTTPSAYIYEGTTIEYTPLDSFDLPNGLYATKEGYEFIGWLVASGDDSSIDWIYETIGGQTYKTAIKIGSFGSVVLVAVWTPATYRLYIDATDNGTIETIGDEWTEDVEGRRYYKEVQYTSAISGLPTAIHRVEYYAPSSTWVDEDGNILTTFDRTEDIWLYPQWELRPYTLTLLTNFTIDDYDPSNLTSGNSGSATISTISGGYEITYKYGDAFALPLPTNCTMANKGYNFLGWTEDMPTNANAKWEVDGEYKTGLKENSYGNIVLESQQEKIKYTLQANATSGTFSGVTLTDGWSLDESSSKLAKRDIYIGDTYVPLPSNPKYSGFVLLGWYTEDGEKISSSRKLTVEDLSEVPDGGTIEISARWSEDATSYYIEFDLSGAGSDAQIKNYSNSNYDGTKIIFNVTTATFDLPNNSQVLSNGYEFLGWKLDGEVEGMKWTPSNGYKTAVEKGSYIKTDGIDTITLKADWEPIEYTLQLNLNEGSMVEDNGKLLYSPAGVVCELDEANNKLTITFTIKDGFNLPTSAHITREGWIFDGWYSNKDLMGTAEIKIEAGTMENKTYYAKWSGATNNIVINENGGQDVDNLTYKTKDEAQTVELPELIHSNKGMAFAGWEVTKINGKAVTATNKNQVTISGSDLTISANVSGEIEVDACWEEIEYTIKARITIGGTEFDDTLPTGWTLLDSKTATKIVTYTEQFGELPTVISTGRFAGWSSKDGGAVDVTTSSSLESFAHNDTESVMNIYACKTGSYIKFIEDDKYSEIKDYSLLDAVYIANERKVEFISTDNFILPTADQLEPTDFGKGYEFVGWEISYETGSIKWVKNADKHVVRVAGGEGTAEVTAKWQPKTFTILANVNTATAVTTVSLNGWTKQADGNYIKQVEFNTAYGELPDIKSTGLKFEGWYSRAIGGDKIYSTTIFNDISQTTIYAHWNYSQYEITLELQDYNATIDAYNPSGDGSNGTANIINNVIYYIMTDKFDLPTADHVQRTGYTFLGWLERTSSGIDWGESNGYKTSLPEGSTSNATLVAQWTPNKHTLTANANSGKFNKNTLPTDWTWKEDEIATKTINFAGEYGELPTPTRDGYSFDGWWTKDVDGDKVTSKTTLTIDGNITIYAHWTATPHHIIFDLSGAGDDAIIENYDNDDYDSSNQWITFTIEDGRIVLPDDTQTVSAGYKFLGWAEKMPINSNAKWETDANSYKTALSAGSHGDTTLQAVWEKLEYTLELDLNDGSMVEDGSGKLVYSPSGVTCELNKPNNKLTIKFTITDSFDLPTSIEITRGGWSFDGWKLIDKCNVNFVQDSNNSNYVVGVQQGSYCYIYGKSAVSASIQASWSSGSNNIEIDANGGTIVVDKLSYETSAVEQDIDLSTCLPIVPIGKEFEKWEVSQHCLPSGSQVSISGNTLTIPANGYGKIIVKAVWKDITYTLKAVITIDGASFKTLPTGWTKADNTTAQKSVTYSERFGTLPIVAFNGRFAGWSTESGNDVGNVADNSSLSSLNHDGQSTEMIIYSCAASNYVEFVKDNKYEINTSEYKSKLKADNSTAEYISSKYRVEFVSSDWFNLPTVSELTMTQDGQGYQFVGWEIETDSNSIKWEIDDDRNITGVEVGSTGTAVVKPIWKAKVFTVTADINTTSTATTVSLNGWTKQADGNYTKEVEFNTAYGDLPNIKVEGQIFDDWWTEKSGGDEVVAGTILNVAKDVTIYAHWRYVGYTIKLDLSGANTDARIDGYSLPDNKYDESEQTISFTTNDAITLPDANQTLSSGYGFKGWAVKSGNDSNMKWNISNNHITGFEKESRIESDSQLIILQAEWDENTYTITAITNEGTINNLNGWTRVSAQKATKTIKFTEDFGTLPTAYSDIYRFKGWATEDGASVANVSENATIHRQTLTDVTIYAVWGDEIDYVITLQLDDGEVYSGAISTSYNIPEYNPYTKQITYSATSAIDLPTKEQTSKTGYEFIGWVVDDGDESTVEWKEQTIGGQTYKTGIKTGSVGNIALLAKWKLLSYTITLDLSDGSSMVYEEGVLKYNPTATYNDTTKTITYTVEDDFGLPVEDEIKYSTEGFDLLGWTQTSSSTTLGLIEFKTNSNDYYEGVNVGSYGTATLVPVWADGRHKIYMKDSADATPKLVGYYATRAEAQDVSLESNVPAVPVGYTFNGLEFVVNSSPESQQTEGNIYSITIVANAEGDITVQPVWNPITYYVSFNFNGGTAVTQNGVWSYDPSPAILLTSPYKVGYTIEQGFTLPTGATLTKDGFQLIGWEYASGDTLDCESNNEGKFVTVKSGNTSNTNLIAYWKAVPYTITLDTNGGTISDSYNPNYNTATSVGDATYGANSIGYSKVCVFDLPNQAYITKPNYNFVGWMLTAKDSQVLVWGEENTTIFYNNPVGTQLGLTISGKLGNVTLQAMWEAKPYAITLLLDGSSNITKGQISNYEPGKDVVYNPSDNTIEYSIESEFDLPNAEQTTKTGYTFIGWMLIVKDTSAKGWGEENTTIFYNAPTGEQLGLTISEKSGGVTLQAIWETISYTINFELNSATDKSLGQIVNYAPTGIKFEGDATSGYKITYTIEDSFNLPNNLERTQVKKDDYNFSGWRLKENTGANVLFNKTAQGYLSTVNIGSYGSATLVADWDAKPYTLILHYNGGKLTGYRPSVVSYSVKSNSMEITYTIESTFNLPNSNNGDYVGHTLTGWKVTTSDGNWEAKDTVIDVLNKTVNISEKSGNVELEAIWVENQYTIAIHSNNGNNTTITEKVTYSQEFTIDQTFSYNDHIFIGWAMQGWNQTQRYEDIDENFTTSNISGPYAESFGNKILQNGASVSKLTKGDVRASETIDIYAIWLPIYNITIMAGDGGAIYKDGVKTSNTSFVITQIDNKTSQPITSQHFKQGYELYTQLDNEIFEEPKNGTRVYRHGYYINGWTIKVGNALASATQYFTTSPADPSYTDWVETADATKYVQSGVNLQYLQGNIFAIPNWTPLTFDVRFVTSSNEEAYKEGYDDTYVSQVTYGDSYTIAMVANNSTNPSNHINTVEAIDIKGYSVIYAHPYNEDAIDTNKTIELQGNWEYYLAYKQYTRYDTYVKDEGWYIIIEGYYAPDLYRLKLDLQLPNAINNTLSVVANGFAQENITESELQYTYSAKILESGNKYVDSTNYIARQHKLYKAGSNYYIYLLQDQIVENKTIYDRYKDGKTISNPTDEEGALLPIFEMDYYTMQYYYTYSEETYNANLYQMATLDGDHKQLAQEKLTQKGAKSISENTDWKYAYCDINEGNQTLGGDLNRFKLNLYWYRNIVNLDISNLLDAKDTFNGYSLITEIEQVTGTNNSGVITYTLEEHSKYHLVIYTQNGSVFTYTTYSFGDDGMDSLKSGSSYDYSEFLKLFDTKTETELLALGISKQTTTIIPIYFGNGFTVQAIDQSKDHSLDEFIGFRFDKYTYNTTSANCTSVSELDAFTNDGTNYAVTVNLQNYEQGATTNYLLDKEILSIDIHFAAIMYKFNYQVVEDVNGEYIFSSKYGKIRFEYQSNIIVDYKFEYLVGVNSNNTLTSNVNIRLGSEVLKWVLKNQHINEDLSDKQLCEFVVTPTFLRNNLYNHTNDYSSAPTQNVGDVNAVCDDINFAIEVKVKDISKDSIIRKYTLKDNTDNKLFTVYNLDGSNTNTVSIDNQYTIKMLAKESAASYVYYYQGQQYAITKLYIAPSLSHSTNQLVTEFDYPVVAFDDIAMNVNSELLDGTINYTQFIQVESANRYLQFYVEVAPTFEIKFNVKKNENDKYKDNRQITLGNIVVASASEGQALQSKPKYVAHWGQEMLFNFSANRDYYKNAQLSIDYTNELLIDTSVSILVNSNIKFVASNEATITIELIPQTYNLTAFVEYKGVRYNTSDIYGANGELPISQLTNSNGKQIIDSVSLKADLGNISTEGVYYYGDKINITYSLNSGLTNAFDVVVYSNQVKLSKNTLNIYVAQFAGKDIEIRILVKGIADQVTLTTNMPSYIVGEIYAQINEGEMVVVQNETYNDETSFTLESGDKLNVYIKTKVGFEFTGKYEYSFKHTTVRQTAAEGEYVGFAKFTMFASGFDISQKGYYYLQFEQIPIDVQFKYYTTQPVVEEDLNAGKDYSAISDTLIAQENSVITITKGTDRVGYRFDGYTYAEPKGVAGSKEFDLTTINETQQQFTIDDTILQYLQDVEVENGKLPLVIYVNYVKQYTFKFEYLCDKNEVSASVTDAEGKPLIEGKHYDYNLELNIDVHTIDTRHNKLEVTISNGIEEENILINSENKDSISFKETTLTNLENLAGFVLNKSLTSNYVITINTILEKYDTKLNQNLYKQVDSVDTTQTTNLIEKGSDLFHLYENIYYKVDSTHDYGTQVTVTIYVLKPPTQVDKTKQYYTISLKNGASLNGQQLSIREIDNDYSLSDSNYLLDNAKCNVYQIQYSLFGENLPVEMILDIDFKALYYLGIS